MLDGATKTPIWSPSFGSESTGKPICFMPLRKFAASDQHVFSLDNGEVVGSHTILLIKKIRIPNLNRAVGAMNIHIRVDAELVSDRLVDICRESLALTSKLA